MNDPARTLLGIDYGTRRIGLACGDRDRRLAFAVGTHEEGRDGSILVRLRGLIDERGIDTIVVGLPRRADGAEGEIADRARRFAQRLEAEFQLPCILWDERYSSQEADRWLAPGRSRDKGQRDALAAEIILQSYLDSLASDDPADPPKESP
jgi:putative Holliday junction resolvase